MKKTFKKAIAVLLAVLMVAFSVPFSALAAPGDYHPDFDIMFGTFHHGQSSTWTDYSTMSGADYSMCGIFDVPVDMNFKLTNGGITKSGTLYIDKDKANKAAETLGYDALTEDYQLGVGDYFTMTSVVKNVDHMAGLMFALQYSTNIEPAGYYSYKQGRGTAYAVGTLSDCEAAGGTWQLGGPKSVDGMSAISVYPGVNSTVGNQTQLVTDDEGINYIWIQDSIQNGDDYADVTSSYNEYYANPETGDLSSGYTYEGTAILETYVFKIIDEGPIEFSVYDPYDEIRGGYEGGSFTYTAADTTMLAANTTYAYNYYDMQNNITETETAGSRKFTAFGANINVAPVEEGCSHSKTEVRGAVEAACTTNGYTGDTWCLDCGEKIADGQTIPATNHSYEITADTTSSCTVAGKTTYTCSKCGDTYDVTKDLADHTPVTIPAVAPTCTTDGSTEGTKCSVCEKVLVEPQVDPATDHSPALDPSTVKEATCTDPGYTGDTKCTVCGAVITAGQATDPTGHDWSAWTSNNDGTHSRVCANDNSHTESADCSYSYEVVTPATEVAEGTGRYTCSACGYSYDVTIPKTDCSHATTEVRNAVEATCTKDGYTGDTKCTVCGAVITAGQVILATGHQHTEVRDAKEATITSEGYTGDTYCLDCGEKIATGETIAKLPSVQVTVEATDLAEQVALDERDVTDGATIAYAVNADITLSTKPLEGAEFLGWAVNGNIVSSENPYSTKAISTVTYVPVFTETAADTFTVVFIDNYGNVISTQTVASAAEITAPTAPARPGYTFAGWSVDYTALTEGATVVAKYTKDAAALYTVTATGCTITTAAGETATDVMTDVPYDTKVTITNNGDAASSWTIGGATVAFGESYTFYVGSDVEVTPAFDAAVEAVPTVSAVSVDELVDASTGRTKAVFLATRSMTSDCKLIANGFIYGKNLADTAITLEDVDGSTVKRVQNSSNAAQFSLTYSLKAQTGTMVARAYLTYENADGEIVTIYAEPQTYTYA